MLTGNDGFVAAVAALIFREGRVLAMRRSQSKDVGAGLWETVSGRIAPGEQPLEALEREIAEETALEVRIDPRPVDAYTMRRGDRPMLVVLYRCDWVSGEVRRSEEHDDHAWWTPDEFEAHSTLDRLARAIRAAAR